MWQAIAPNQVNSMSPPQMYFGQKIQVREIWKNTISLPVILIFDKEFSNPSCEIPCSPCNSIQLSNMFLAKAHRCWNSGLPFWIKSCSTLLTTTIMRFSNWTRLSSAFCGSLRGKNMWWKMKEDRSWSTSMASLWDMLREVCLRRRGVWQVKSKGSRKVQWRKKWGGGGDWEGARSEGEVSMYEHPALLKAENYFRICCDDIHRCLILQIICYYPNFNNSPGDYLRSTSGHT